MSGQNDTTADVLDSIWTVDYGRDPSLDEDCSPTKACRNMKDVTFDGYAEAGTDLATAWRDRLAREGKLNEGGSVRDLILGRDTQP